MRYKLIRDVKPPERGTPLSAGIDFFVPNSQEEIELSAGEDVLIPSGVIVRFDHPTENYCLIAMDKSGVCLKKHLSIGAKLVDQDYQGELHLHVFNHGNYSIKIYPGEKLVQFVVVPCIINDIRMDNSIWEFSTTKRGDGGFGSTGDGLTNDKINDLSSLVKNNRKKLKDIKQLLDKKIKISLSRGEPVDKIDFREEWGVLLTIEEANLIYSFLNKVLE